MTSVVVVNHSGVPEDVSAAVHARTLATTARADLDRQVAKADEQIAQIRDKVAQQRADWNHLEHEAMRLEALVTSKE